MNKTLMNIFNNSKVLLASCVVGCICFIVAGVLYIGDYSLFSYAFPLFCVALLLISLFVSYKNGETNRQKSLMGALLFYLFADNLDMFATSLDFNGISNIITIRTGISVVLALVIFYNYLVAQSDHVGIQRNVIISQVAIFAMFIFFIVSFIQTLKTGVLVSDIFFYIAQISTYIMIVCIETKVQIYKGIRMKLKSENAWNDNTRIENKKIFKL